MSGGQPGRVFYWVHHTSRYAGNTGVQRVVRGLGAGFVERNRPILPVGWCGEREAIVHAGPESLAGLARFQGPDLRVTAGSHDTPIHLAPEPPRPGDWLLLPEVPHVDLENAPSLAVVFDYARFHGLRLAVVFYDLIPLCQPGYEVLAQAHAQYARVIHAADLVLPISRQAGADLEAWWRGAGFALTRLPRLRPIPLPEEQPGIPHGAAGPEPTAGPIRFLAVGTVEPRKNQLALIGAFRRLRQRRPELDLALDIVGTLHGAVAEAVTEAARMDPSIRLHGYLDDEAVLTLARTCHATAFVSLVEGYGLPIAESLWLGRPCLASSAGCMAEITAGGGCLEVDPNDPAAIEAGLERLATEPALRQALTEAALRRPVRRWRDYADAVDLHMAATPPVHRLVLLEGSFRTAATDAAELEAADVIVDRLHWRADTRAIIPGANGIVAQPRPGDGRLGGSWALLPAHTVSDTAEAVAICAEAHGLGLRVAVSTESQPAAALLASADLMLLPDQRSRDGLVAAAMRELPRTALLRARAEVAASTRDMLSAMAAVRPLPKPSPAPMPPSRVFYWVDLTITQPFNTGVQRVTRLLAAGLQRLGVEVIPVKWNGAEGRIVGLTQEESAHLARWSGPTPGGGEELPGRFDGEWLILPEVSVPEVPMGIGAARLARDLGFRVAAIFYDMIPAKLAQHFPPEALAQLRAYWSGFALVDVALPISWTVAADLRRHFAATGLPSPVIIPCPLAGELPDSPRVRAPITRNPAAGLRLLAIGTLEPRKNYPRLLRALRAAAAAGHEGRLPQLTIVGRRAGFAELDAEIERLAAEAGNVSLRDHVTDEELHDLLAASDATVFASWEEGFGLPVLESLWRGLPCLCHDGSAMAEVAPGGGVLAVDMLDEAAIAEGLRRLADEPGLLASLSAEAVARPIRDWDGYAADVLHALAHSAAPGWPLPAVITKRSPLLSLAITTYNRAPWLQHSLPRLIEAARPWRDVVEVVVCDNTSTDDTPAVIARHAGEGFVTARRNPVNVGMLGNLGATARACNGAFVWLLGDDDLIVDGALENVLEGLVRHPDVEMAYTNYAYTHFDAPEELADAAAVIRGATTIAPRGANRRVPALREVAALNENLFTAIYCCVFRRDHALRAYQLDTRGAPFSSLQTCVPSSVYALNMLMDRPAWWVGQPAVVVNMNVSWLRWRLLWHLERMPDLYDLAERAGARPEQVDRYRLNHCANAAEHLRLALFESPDEIRGGISVERLLERCKHLPEFREGQLAALFDVYERAWTAGRVIADDKPPRELFAAFGLASEVGAVKPVA